MRWVFPEDLLQALGADNPAKEALHLEGLRDPGAGSGQAEAVG